jgi:hypothetical protein
MIIIAREQGRDGRPSEFEQLTDEELERAIIDHTRELAELDP